MNADFGRLVANAQVMGIVIDEDQLRAAEAYNDALSTANQRIVAMAANMKATKEAMEFLAENAEAFSEAISAGSDGKVDKRYADKYEGIGDAAEALQARLKKNNKERYDAIQAEIKKLAELKTAQQISQMSVNGPVYIPEKQREQMTQANMKAASQEIWFKEVSYEDPRFNPNDRKTWTQKRKNPAPSAVNDPEKIKNDQIAAAVKRTTDEFEKKRKKHEESLAAYDKELDYQKEIARIEQETGGKLTEEQALQVKNALLEYQIERNKEIVAEIKKTNEEHKADFEIQKALLQGDTARAEKLKLINNLKKQGLIISEKEFNNSGTTQKNLSEQVKETESKILTLSPDKKKYDNAIKERDKLKRELADLDTKQKDNLNRQKENIGTYTVNDKEIEEYEKRRLEIIKERENKIAQIKKNEEIIGRTKKSAMQYDDLSKQLKVQQADLSNADTVAETKKQLELQEQLRKKQEELKKTKTLNDMSDDLARQNEIMKAQIDGDLERVNLLNLINELKSKGIAIDEKELKKNKEKYAELLKQRNKEQELNLKNNLKDQLDNLQLQVMKISGFGKEVAELEAIRNAEKVKGANLTKQEINQVKKLADLQYEFENINTHFTIDGKIMTNELASRGGGMGSIRIIEGNEIQNQIKGYIKRQNDILLQIKAEIQAGGII